jgi:hypothetical protein
VGLPLSLRLYAPWQERQEIMCVCDGGFSALSTTAAGSVSSVAALMRKVAVLIVGGGLMRALIWS